MVNIASARGLCVFQNGTSLGPNRVELFKVCIDKPPYRTVIMGPAEFCAKEMRRLYKPTQNPKHKHSNYENN